MLKRQKTIPLKRKKKGQSTVEYIILVAGVLAAILVFVPGIFSTSFNAALSSAANQMTNFSGRLSGSYPNQ
ncbi:hypothetical protein MNBD_UNCLBAC01-563 [hydrothermal vent metagenome]|uniref:Uncharacterized protein n=1 Tax=hydrothermal vent metagenome TaxID=652676 RepID=A0A3B1E4I5_9ZZZZ